MNKAKAFLDGYMNKEAANLVEKSQTLDQLEEEFFNNPRVKYSKYLAPGGALLGATVGAGLGAEVNGALTGSDLKNILLLGSLGAATGGLAGYMTQERIRWPAVQDFVRKLRQVKDKQ